MKAKAIQNALLVRQWEHLPNGVRVVIVECESSTQFKALPHAITYQDQAYGRSAWNSDRFIAYYRTDIMHVVAFARP